MDYQLRPATSDDLPEIISIYNSTIASRQVTADITPITLADRHGWLESHQQQGHPVYAIFKAETLIGWFSFSPFYGRPAYRHTCEISIYLAPQARGQGLGKWILPRTEQIARQQGIKVLLGFIFSHNIPSIKLFEHNEYQRWGELPQIAELDEQRYSLSILGKHLDAV
ncbi:GNAT family N-acetyltransferase [Celerinatantimonas yamalensis]|uniref:N-acetyltransferase family protein n=1 Tax=Celerinatantimonas yamalensis TaxID=559956 RepID=A0ABW9GAB0_9GAMM